MASRRADLMKSGDRSEPISPPPPKKKEKVCLAVINPSLQYDNPKSRIVGASGKRHYNSPTINNNYQVPGACSY